ncbi:MAG: hypothetical protein NUW01_09125 [Gemmatimonadaceae bacterium]|nr:hypothetical protein [Gemmatimonadaceae bacterium]
MRAEIPGVKLNADTLQPAADRDVLEARIAEEHGGATVEAGAGQHGARHAVGDGIHSEILLSIQEFGAAIGDLLLY